MGRQAWLRHAGLARKIGYGFLLSGMAAILAWVGWPGDPSSAATLISRVDVVAAVALIIVVPWLVARKFGPCDPSGLSRAMRLAGCAAVFALILVKTHVERSDFAQMSRSLWLPGIWAGEVLFLLIIAAYVAGVFIVTAKRAPAGRAALATGTGAGAMAGLILYALPPRGSSLHLATGWMTDTYQIARILAVPLVVSVAVVAGVKTARRTARLGKRRVRIETQTRQGLAAGACAGVAAAIIVSILGLSTIALVPQDARVLEWTLPGQHIQPGTVYSFEVSVSAAAAGYLLVLLVFPLIGAGLGAWGGLYGSDRPGNPPGGGGGGRGPKDKNPKAPPPPGGKKLDPVTDIGRLLSLPEWDPAARPVAPEQAPRREKVPARSRAVAAGRSGTALTGCHPAAGWLARGLGHARPSGPVGGGLRRPESVADHRLGGPDHYVERAPPRVPPFRRPVERAQHQHPGRHRVQFRAQGAGVVGVLE
jgi:hypothetical protein